MLEILQQLWDALRYLKIFYPLLLAGGLAAAWRSPRAARWTRWAMVVLLALSWAPVAWVNHRLLELPFVSLPEAPPVEAIVVLSGGAEEPSKRFPYAILLESTVRRARQAAELGRARPDLPILVCGPVFPRAPEHPSVAQEMGLLLRGWGISEDRIWLEQKGRSTSQQSVEAAAILRQKGARRILLVTDAFHMRRSLGVFRNQGLEAFPAPSHFAATPLRAADLIPSSGAMLRNEEALREWLALAVYKARGAL